jgi:hypothetical protein
MNVNRGIKPPVVTYSIAFTGTSTAATDVSHGASGVQQMVFCAETADCWIAFGDAAVGAADSGDWPLFAGQPMMFEVGNPQKYVRVIRQASTSGTLKFYIVGEAS